MKAMLLRVGIDKGTDGTLAPIFEDGSFEYIPISEGDSRSKEDRTYKNTIGRSGKPLSTYLPKVIENRTMHFDPEFETFTYGDPTSKRKYLLKLEKRDLLVFYAGLTPFKNNKYREALYIIGYFTLWKVIDFNQLTEKEIEKCYQFYPNNAHLKRSYDTEDLVIVVGDKNKSKLLDKAILISQTKYGKNGRPYQAVSNEMVASLGISGSIQRSIPPRFIRNKNNLNNLKHILGL
ncbi:MAG: hypothetical protein J7J38_00445 [Candidatus Aenigmarchaeota archaeon]|nr:hypothetical protein [Candidatus Aenigmarchaeota archaeon]